jgi:putative nucleotidyltransferase with HDIG domain
MVLASGRDAKATMITTAIQPTQACVDKLLSGVETVITLPEITTRIAAVVNDHRSTARDLHWIISHDPALVSRLLRLVNSSFYGRPIAVDSVERAIVLLGFDAVYHLAIAATLGPLFKGGKVCDGFTAKDLWTHCVAVAAVAKEMAHWVGYPPSEEAFLAGLLHDVGMIASLQVCRGQLRKVCERCQIEDVPFTSLEFEIVGASHENLGAALAKHWKFPATVREVAAYHHDPLSASEQFRTFAVLVHIADVLCCQQKIGFYLSADRQPFDESAFADIISPSVVNLAREKLQSWVEPAIKIFT